MKGDSAIWVIAPTTEKGARVYETLSAGRLINPVVLLPSTEAGLDALEAQAGSARLIVLDLEMPGAWDFLAWTKVGASSDKPLVIALVNRRSEAWLDRAYEAGVQTYLREGFQFSDFLERARHLGLQFVLGRDERARY